MALSFTGLVLGMQQMDVNPPAAAAREPLSMVSACSNPGSRRCTCISMKPGATIIPVASNTSAFGEARLGATPATRPSTISTSATRSVFEDGSITLPFLITIGMLSNHLFEHRHAHRNSVLHLVEDHRPLEIGHLAGEFAPAIDRPRMHHDGFRLGQVHVLQLQAVEAEILAGRKTRLMLPLQLHAQHHDNVGVLQGVEAVGGQADARST